VRIAALSTFERHLSDAAPDLLAPVYSLLSDAYEAKLALRALSKAFLQIEDDTRAVVSLDGEGLRLSRLSESLEGAELFASRRIVAISQADKLAKPLVDEIQRYLQRPIPSVCLVIITPVLLRTTNFYKSLEKVGVIFEPVDSKENSAALVPWVLAHFAAANKQLSSAAASHLVNCCSNDRMTIHNEMEKLICYVGTRREILLEDIEKFLHFTPVESIWLLAEALLSGQGAKARRIARQTVLQESDFFSFSRLMRSQFQTLCQVASILSHGGSNDAVQQQLPQLRGAAFTRTIALARSSGVDLLKTAIIKIDEIELKAKNSQGSPYLLVDILLTTLLVPEDNISHASRR
jgi:DNA polymerase-3 subunit delta